MTYKEFLAEVQKQGLSLAQLRCDVPPSESVLDLIEDVGPDYERFVMRFSTVNQDVPKIGQ